MGNLMSKKSSRKVMSDPGASTINTGSEGPITRARSFAKSFTSYNKQIEVLVNAYVPPPKSSRNSKSGDQNILRSVDSNQNLVLPSRIAVTPLDRALNNLESGAQTPDSRQSRDRRGSFQLARGPADNGVPFKRLDPFMMEKALDCAFEKATGQFDLSPTAANESPSPFNAGPAYVVSLQQLALQNASHGPSPSSEPKSGYVPSKLGRPPVTNTNTPFSAPISAAAPRKAVAFSMGLAVQN